MIFLYFWSVLRKSMINPLLFLRIFFPEKASSILPSVVLMVIMMVTSTSRRRAVSWWNKAWHRKKHSKHSYGKNKNWDNRVLRWDNKRTRSNFRPFRNGITPVCDCMYALAKNIRWERVKCHEKCEKTKWSGIMHISYINKLNINPFRDGWHAIVS